jgi:hypothetical protein
MTALSNVTENCHGDYYGAKLEVPVLHPGTKTAWGVRTPASKQSE